MTFKGRVLCFYDYHFEYLYSICLIGDNNRLRRIISSITYENNSDFNVVRLVTLLLNLPTIFVLHGGEGAGEASTLILGQSSSSTSYIESN